MQSDQTNRLPPPGTISQVCYATHNLEAAVDTWTRTAGAGPFYLIDLPASLPKTYRGKPAQDGFRAAMGFMGLTLIEFIQPTNDKPSIIREILDTRGEGAVQHIFPHIRPLDGAGFDKLCGHYRSLGLEEALYFELPGVGRNSFFDATATLGFFLEVLEFGQEAYEFSTARIYQAHLTEERSGPLRSLF